MNQISKPTQLALLFLFCRLMLVIALPLDGLRGFGDLAYFFLQAGSGTPFLQQWVEYPPVFPFLSYLLHQFSGGQEHVYDYALVLILSLCQAASVALFARLDARFHKSEPGARSWFFFILLLALPYGWWYFDPLAVLSLLLSLVWLLEGKALPSGLAIAFGILTKWFPGLLLAAAWRWLPPKKALVLTVAALGLPLLVWGGLYLASPDLTAASLLSQAAKGSWETVWSLMDGNFNTGNFGSLAERVDPLTAFQTRGNPAVFPPLLTLIPFALAGLVVFLRARLANPRQATAFLGLAYSLFFLWSPGWSPQWVLYLLPLVLLALPENVGRLAAMILALVNLLEWPVLLSRGYFQGLLLTVPLRTLMILILAVLFFRITVAAPEKTEVEASIRDKMEGRTGCLGSSSR